MRKKGISGIYILLNLYDNKVYVGGSVRVSIRIAAHFRELERGMHHNYNLQSAYDLNGRDAFVFSLLEECNPDEIRTKEQYWLDNLVNKYNIIPHAQPGGCWSDKHAERIGLAQKGKKASQHVRDVASQTHKGKVISEEHKERIRQFNRSRPGVNKGRKWSEEYKEKMSKIGKERWARKRAGL